MTTLDIPAVRFSEGRKNRKVKATADLTFSLPAGWTCPAALDCMSKADPLSGAIKDGPATVIRCFAASMESSGRGAKAVRRQRWYNLDALNKARQASPLGMYASIYKGLENSFSAKVFKEGMLGRVIRVHVSGDFFSEDYLRAWLKIARTFPRTLFYGYTKRIDLFVNARPLPSNFRFAASLGGRFDHLIPEAEMVSARVVYSEQEAEELGLKIDHDDSLAQRQQIDRIAKMVSARVVYSEQEAEELGLKIDHDDSLAQSCAEDFALLIHGNQPKGSKAAKALSELRKSR